MIKQYGRRLRISPEEEQMIMRLRSGIDKSPKLERKLPKILLMDIETAPIKGWIWNLKTHYVNPSMLDEDNKLWWMISWAGKWLFEDEVYGEAVTPTEAINRDDFKIAHSMWKMLDEADVVITHNGRKFDHKMLNTRFMLHGLPPPSPYRIIDTLTVARSTILLPSYKLSFIADVFGISQKVFHEGFQMWVKCTEGDPEALSNMLKYNKGDIIALEDFYLFIRPWIKNHPNIGIYNETEKPVCPVCGNEHVDEIEGNFSTTNVSKFQNYRCSCCGAISKKRTTALPLRVRKALVTPV